MKTLSYRREILILCAALLGSSALAEGPATMPAQMDGAESVSDAGPTTRPTSAVQKVLESRVRAIEAQTAALESLEANLLKAEIDYTNKRNALGPRATMTTIRVVISAAVLPGLLSIKHPIIRRVAITVDGLLAADAVGAAVYTGYEFKLSHEQLVKTQLAIDAAKQNLKADMILLKEAADDAHVTLPLTPQ